MEAQQEQVPATSMKSEAQGEEPIGNDRSLMDRHNDLRLTLHGMRMKEACEVGEPRQSGEHFYTADFFDSLPAAEKDVLKSEGKRRRREMKLQSNIGVPPAHPPLLPKD
jgi:hypothetical protein